MKNIILCGIGGQGTILASKLIATAAMNKGMPVMSAETIGMAQRGGSVFSHLRMGEGISSPMIKKGQADMIIGFEPGETVRMMPYLKKGGTVITSSRAVMPITSSVTGGGYSGNDMLDYLKSCDCSLTVADTETACAALGNYRIVNVLLLGCAVRTGELGLTADDIKEAIRTRLKEKLWDLNFRALDYAF